jgi:hypothetical protein
MLPLLLLPLLLFLLLSVRVRRLGCFSLLPLLRRWRSMSTWR